MRVLGCQGEGGLGCQGEGGGARDACEGAIRAEVTTEIMPHTPLLSHLLGNKFCVLPDCIQGLRIYTSVSCGIQIAVYT